MNNYKIIDVIVSNPALSLFKGSGNDRAACITFSCNNSQNCDLYKRGECAMRFGLSGANCPYGKRNREVGPTKRSKSFSEWITKRRGSFKDVLNKLSSPKILGCVGDYVFLPYAHITGINRNTFLNNKIPLSEEHSDFGHVFVKKDLLTVDVVKDIASGHPEALFGGEIKSYQKEEVPKFMLHLSDVMPELYNEFILKYPEYASKKPDNVGRKAILQTLNPNIGEFKDIHGGLWVWDSEYATSKNSRMNFGLCEFTEIRIKPKDNVVVVISDNAQVKSGTKFIT